MYINRTERHNLYQGLDLFLESFRPYIVSILIERFGSDWSKDFAKTLYSDQRENWHRKLSEGKRPDEIIDFQYLRGFAIDKENQRFLKEDFKYETGSLATWCGEIYDARNGVAHFDSALEEDKAVKAWINLRTIARLIGNTELEQQLRDLQKSEPTQKIKSVPKAKPVSIHYSIETLDIVNCAGLWQEVFADEVYFCPVEGSSYTHRQCKYFGVYFQKRVGAVGEIEAVVDVYSEGEAEIYWTNTVQDDRECIEKAKEKANQFRPNELPLRVFLLKNLSSTNFIKDSKGGMQTAKTYLNIEDLNVGNARELAELLKDRNWSEFGK